MASKKYTVAVVGIGVVGTEMLRVLRQRNFPVGEIRILARHARTEEIDGVSYEVRETKPEAFDGVDIAIFAGTEGAKGASQAYGWEAVKRGAIVIDNGDDFRMDDRVPLVVPEVNPEHLRAHKGFIANPNCSTIQMVVALGPLHRAARIKRVIVSTYQAVSGTGRGAIKELRSQIDEYIQGKPLTAEVYQDPIAFNLFPHISGLKDIFPGYYGEEIKMIRETRKILDMPNLAVSATCVRVPVFNAHSETVNVEFERKITADEAREILGKSSGIVVLDDPAKGIYPTPLMASGTDPVYVGRIREDSCNPNTLDFFVVSDNIRKGAALNAVQNAEKMIEMGLL